MKRTIAATAICALLLGLSLSTWADDTHLVPRRVPLALPVFCELT